MTSEILGALDQPTMWTLQQVGRLLLRARPLSPSTGPDAWYVLVPETTQTISAGGQNVQVTLNLVFAGNEQLGATIRFQGAGAQHVDLTVFLNVGTTTPSWAYVGVLADTEALPTSLTIRVTTPASSLLSSTHTAITAKIDTVNTNTSLMLRLGRADLPTGPVSAAVNLTLLDLSTATAALAAHGLSLAGLPLPPSGSGTVNAQAPAADPGKQALTNNAVPSMTDVTAVLTRPDLVTPLGSSTWTVSVDQVDGSASAQPSTTTIDWSASDVFTAKVELYSKDPAVRQGLEHRTSTILAKAGGLPRTIQARLTTMPDIAFPGTSPDPALAQPAMHYTAGGRLASLDLTTVSQSSPVSPLPAGGTPTPNASAHLVVTDVPRQAIVMLGQWDPNHHDDTFVDVRLLDQLDQLDALGHLAVAAAPTIAVPALLSPGTSQQLYVEGTAGPRKAALGELQTLTVKVQPRPVTTTQTVTTADIHYLASAAAPARLTVLDDDLGSTVVTADLLPAEVTISAQLPDLATLQDASASWSGSAHWTAAASMSSMRVVQKAPPNAPALGKDQLALDLSVTDLPGDVRISGANNGVTARTDIEWLAAAPVTRVKGTVDLNYYSQVLAPFLSVAGSVEEVPRGVAVGINRSTPGVDIEYGGSELVAQAECTVRSTDLIAPKPGQFVPFNRAQVVVVDIPKTASEPAAVAAGPRLAFLLDTTPNLGLVAHVDVPSSVEAIGSAHLRVVDDRPSPTEGDTFSTPIGVRWVNRPRVLVGDVDDLPGAPVGSLLVLTLPRLRSARYDERDGQSLPATFTIATGATAPEKAFGVALALDAPEAVTLELALDDTDGSTWVSGTLSSVQAVALDGQLSGTSSNGAHLATEILPRGGIVDATVQRYDRSLGAVPDFGPSADGLAAERLLRSTLAHLLVTLPDRVEARLNCPAARLDAANGMATTQPAARRGSQLLGGQPVLLVGQPTTTSRLSGWISGQHGFVEDIARWKDFCLSAVPRAQYEVRRTSSSVVIPHPETNPLREVHDVGVGPSTLLESNQVDAVLLARVEHLRGLEVSTQTTPAQVGSRAQRRYLALLARDTWDFRLAALHLENGQPTNDLFEGNIEHLGPFVEVLLTPEAFATENGSLNRQLKVNAGAPLLTLTGSWAHGFPHAVSPSTTPTLMYDPTVHRPDGVTALDVTLQLRETTILSRHRHWDTADAGHFQATDRWELESGVGGDATGWVVTDRPVTASHPFAAWLQGQLSSLPAPSISAIQGGVRLPDYGQGQGQVTDNPWFMRPGDTAAPHSYAVALEGVRALQLATEKLCDDDQREVPVFVADDSVKRQPGFTATRVHLRLSGPAGPGAVEMVGWEIDDWQDSPPLPRGETLVVHLDQGVPAALAFESTASVSETPGKRPTARSQFTLSSSGSTFDTTGPALGSGSFTHHQLDTASNPWAPVVSSVEAALDSAPGFVRLVIDKFQDISHYPDGSITNLSTPGWDQPGAFDDDHSSTSQTQAWASGPMAGTITLTSSDFRRSNSSQPSPWAASTRFDLSKIGVEIAATPSGPVDLDAAPFALVTGKAGPAGSEAETGLGLYAGCGQLALTGKITTAARYQQKYTSSSVPPTIALTDDTAVLTLNNFSGKLSVQKRGLPWVTLLLTGLASIGVVVLALLASWWFAVFAYVVAELMFVLLLMKLSPIKVDDLCSGDWYLTPRPTTDLSFLRPWVNGWCHTCDPYHWDLKASVWFLLPLLLALVGFTINIF